MTNMFTNYGFTVEDRFLKYVKIDTQSDPSSSSFPSTEKQKNFARLLVEELKQLGITDAEMDEYGYVYATIESNSEKKNIPVICFCAHMDTSPDCSGENVKPIVHRNYSGEPIVLPDDISQVILPEKHAYLKEKIGDDIITASGTTLLGADDKAGIAIIMDMVNFFRENKNVKHGKIKILFTPDEEIGRGVDKLNLVKLGADFAYTLDGGELGSIEDETFSADSFSVIFEGISAHPGYAKGQMVNALKIAADFVNALPKDRLSPESTELKEGFVHPVGIKGWVEKAEVEFIIRDFDTAKLTEHEDFLKQKANDTVKAYPGAKVAFIKTEQYRNMKEVLDKHPKVTAFAKEAITRVGIPVISRSIRGGTDGSRLSFMGLPCPNIFTGEMAFHSKHEYVSVQDMQKSVEVLVALAGIWESEGTA